MELEEQYITAHALIHEVLPRLRTMETLVNNTFDAVIEATDDSGHQARHREQQQAFQLELQMIRLNLDSLMKRHARVLREVQESDGGCGHERLSLDAHETVAITRFRQLYTRVKEWQSR
ncbi:hypothetical protein GCM10007160_20160 [Litchfieldella qijiaojingensis]|uniref:Uncharacterized protein n=1 Tax=Litchfieldella qijiaojingensis TaxID=980347 RepID=A0ABQ2YR58_9GAMM|nr:hypothetical protein [Halomonas qijiaojingensis]GGX92630.1 hypothetical protein GCM10007160_20160 [Halomonas qijiaojingensis]